jgi:hypothetical protein
MKSDKCEVNPFQLFIMFASGRRALGEIKFEFSDYPLNLDFISLNEMTEDEENFMLPLPLPSCIPCWTDLALHTAVGRDPVHISPGVMLSLELASSSTFSRAFQVHLAHESEHVSIINTSRQVSDDRDGSESEGEE